MYDPEITVGVFAATLAAIVGARVFFSSSNLTAWLIGSMIAVLFCGLAMYVLPFIRLGGLSGRPWTSELFLDARGKVNGYVMFWLPYALPGLFGGLAAGSIFSLTMSVIRVTLPFVNPDRLPPDECDRKRMITLASLLGLVFQSAVFMALISWLSQSYAR